ncbi:MAG: hypothetical protein ABI187_13625 [Ornithinibacter sp.]
MPEPVVEVVGVYDADGGVLGEIGYAIGHALGRTECSLCSVTHGSLRRKPQWDELVSELEVPVRLVHRNETSSEERAAYAMTGLPAVLGVRADGAHTVLLGPTMLSATEGSVTQFAVGLREALRTEGVA